MPPENNRFGGGLAETSIHPLVLIAMLVAIPLIIFLPRKYAIVPLLVCSFLTPIGQELYVAGAHLSVSRILIIVGCLRLIPNLFQGKSVLFGGINSVDRAYILCILCQVCGVLSHFFQSQAIVNQFGFLLDFLAAYFLFRGLIREEEDIHLAIKCLALITAVVAVGMVVEQAQSMNIFGLLGGVRLAPEIREGRIRSQGVFQHPILAGTFAATLLPLFVLLWKNGKAKAISLVGIVGSTIMTVTSWSSTPLLAYAAGLLAISLWPFRSKMRYLRWGLVIGLICLHLVMKAPLWFAIAHIDLSGGSSGYHRAMLVEHFVRNFGDWWLLGAKDTSAWGDDMWDVQNQFVFVGVTGGLLALFAFIAVVTRSFRRVGKARKAIEGDKSLETVFWFLGSALFADVVGFFGVNYFDQSRLSWVVLLSMISAATVPLLQESNALDVALTSRPRIFSRVPRSQPPVEGSRADRSRRPWRPSPAPTLGPRGEG